MIWFNPFHPLASLCWSLFFFLSFVLGPVLSFFLSITTAFKQLLQRVRSSTFWKLNYLYLQLYQDRFVVVSVDCVNQITSKEK